MTLRRWLSLGCIALGASLAPSPVLAQLAPIGGHYGGKASDTGFEGAVNSSGGYGASVPLDLPGARGGLPIPIHVVYTEHGFGAAGLGWEVPLSYLRDDTTFAHRRPAGTPGVAPQPREQVSVVLDGQRIDLVRTATAWAARRDAADLEVRNQPDGSWVMFDGQGRTYTFTNPSSVLTGTGLFLLTDITGVAGSNVHLDYNIAASVSIDLAAVHYNPSPDTAGCYKNTVSLIYGPDSTTPWSVSTLSGQIMWRRHTLAGVDVFAKSACGASDELIRGYQLSYQPDADTGQPRLQLVQVLGRAGTPENSTPLPVASYQYGSASNGQSFTYQLTSSPNFPFANIGQTNQSTAPLPPFGTNYSTELMLTDVTGDGRPDLVTLSGGSLTVARNSSSASAISFDSPVQLSDSVMTPRAPEAHTLNSTRYSTTGNVDMTWRQAIDVNGDGRLDIIDAGELAGHWVVYLNTPDPADPRNIRWARRAYSVSALAQDLQARGMTIDNNFLPLAQRTTFRDQATFKCWININGVWTQAKSQSFCSGDPPRELVETTITQWEVRDINGDGFPDVVFNSSPIVHVVNKDPPPDFGEDGDTYNQATITTQVLNSGASNRIDAVMNVLGTRLTNGDDQPFSAPITIMSNDACGVDTWTSSSLSSYEFPNHDCGFEDVNGDGLVDVVRFRSVYLGTGTLSSSGMFTGASFTLPGPLAIHDNPAVLSCAPPATASTTFNTSAHTGLRDVTGDGIPDYIMLNGVGQWEVFVGTGAGFLNVYPVNLFLLSSEQEDCGGTISTTHTGLFDIDGDGKPDVVSGSPAIPNKVWMLTGPSGVPGAPDAGRLVAINNGYGARTNIHYRSIKGDPGIVHQVPFPEIVVDSVATSGTLGLGGDLAATTYAYGGAELMFDPALDVFSFRGYRRRVEVPAPISQAAGVATITITDNYAPVSAVDPYGVAGGAALDATQRYNLYLRAGRTRDVTVLSGNFSAAALAAPSQLLTIDVSSDGRRIGATHYEWGSMFLTASSDPAGPEPCSEMVAPYDYAASTAYASNNPSYDACTARGFAYGASVQSWRGDPGAAPPLTNNVETRTEVQVIDGFGRVQRVKHFGDLHRDDDDVCIDTTYAAPTGSNERVLFATSSQTVSDCATTTYARQSWEYDQLAAGSVSAGLVTAHIVERHDDTGALLGTIRRFDATFDSAGNPSTVSTTREDGATRTVTATYDPFGLAVTSVTVTSPTVTTLTTSVVRDPVTLAAVTVTDPNGTEHGATFDGFQRPVLSTVTPPGGALGVLSAASYLGFSGTDPSGRRVVGKVFTDPVDPTVVDTAPGRTATVFLDELGRARRTEIALGSDYSNQTLIVGYRTYDGLGRVLVAGEPFSVASGQALTPTYATTYYFNADGTPSCFVRGPGQQPFTNTPNESSEIFPTCFTRTFQDHSEVVSVQDAASLLTGSPQYGVKKFSYATAIGRVLTRSTWQGATRLEHAMFSYDRLGHRTGMTRYQDANAGANPVTSSWRFDSLGQMLELNEPGSARQSNTYSNWGELVQTLRYALSAPLDGSGSGSGSGSDGGPIVDNPPPGDPPPPIALQVVNRYDAFGRLIHREQQSDGVVDAATVNDYQYDQPVVVTPHLNPTNVLGRLAQASAPTGTTSFSYDAFGRVNGQVFTDTTGGIYVEQHTTHADGSPASLDLLLPDTGFADEHVDYAYDSAGRGTSVLYSNGSETFDLFEASTIDPLGRLRQAQFGLTSYSASYAEVGRRLLNQVTASSLQGSRSISFGGFDPVGRERSRTEIKNATGTGTTTTFTYDPIGQLSHAVQTAGTATLFDQSYTYDPLGNIVSLSDAAASAGPTTTTLSYLDSDRDRICRIAYGADSSTDCNVTYDEIGNIVSQQTSTGLRQYSYYIDGSVRTISDDKGSVAQFRYDAFGEVQELDLTSNVSLDTRHDRHYGELIAWRDVTTGVSATSVLSRKIPGPHGFAATRRGAGGPWVFEFGESRGSRFFTDEHGAFVQDVDYQPFGTATSTGAQPGSNLYSSEQWNFGDALTAFGISRLGARLYDPAIGRFLSRDPLLLPETAATTNPYAFAANDPVNGSDPSGLFTVFDITNGLTEGENGGGGGFSHDDYGFDSHFHDGTYVTLVPGGSGLAGSRVSSGGTGSKGTSGAAPYPDPFAWTLLYDRYSYHAPAPAWYYPPSDWHPKKSPGLIDSFIDNITDIFTDDLAKILNGIFDLYGAQHPSHVAAVADLRPTVHTLTSITVNAEFLVLGGVIGLEGEAAELAPYEVGRFDALQARSVVGDGLELHHVGQAHALEQVVPGYSRVTAPTIVLPRAEHLKIPNLRGIIDLTPREVLARDIWNLRRLTRAPIGALRKLIELNKSMYPEAFEL